jgi:hypothetical protein
MQMAAQQAQMQFQQSQTNALNAQADESAARAQKLVAEAQAVPIELEIDRINAVTRNLKEGDAEDKEFERRMKLAETLIKEKQVESKTNVDRPRVTNDIPEIQRPVGAVESGNQGLEIPTQPAEPEQGVE